MDAHFWSHYRIAQEISSAFLPETTTKLHEETTVFKTLDIKQ